MKRIIVAIVLVSSFMANTAHAGYYYGYGFNPLLIPVAVVQTAAAVVTSILAPFTYPPAAYYGPPVYYPPPTYYTPPAYYVPPTYYAPPRRVIYGRPTVIYHYGPYGGYGRYYR
jgi:hypothetical protein